MRLVSRICAGMTAWTVGVAAAPGWACPACFAASDAGTRLGYYLSTVVLSLTPLLLMGLGVGYVAFKRGQADREARQVPDPR